MSEIAGEIIVLQPSAACALSHYSCCMLHAQSGKVLRPGRARTWEDAPVFSKQNGGIRSRDTYTLVNTWFASSQTVPCWSLNVTKKPSFADSPEHTSAAQWPDASKFWPTNFLNMIEKFASIL